MLRLTVASLLAHRLRLIMTAAAVAIGVAFLAGTFMLTDSLRGTLNATTTATSVAEVVVQPAGAAGGKTAGTAASLPASLARQVGAVRGVGSVQGLVIADKVTLIGKNGHPITHARAVNELRSYPAIPALSAQYTIQSGHPPRTPDQAMLDAATARSLGYRTGDRIGIVTATGVRTLTISGITGFDGADSPASAQIASLDAPTVIVVRTATAQQLTGLSGRFTEIDALAKPGGTAAALRNVLVPLLPAGATAITAGQAAAQQSADAAGQLASLQTYLLIFCATALLLAAFIIANTFVILTAQRTREYALLRVIGASRSQLMRSALAEAGFLGLVASAAGTGLGVLAATGLRGLLALLGGTLPAGSLIFAPRTAVVALATGTAVTLMSALRPTRLATRVQPVQALREALPVATRPSRARLAAGITGIVAAAALTTGGLLTQSAQNTVLTGAGALAAIAALVVAGPLTAGPVAHLVTVLVTSGRRQARGTGVTTALARDNTTRNPRRTAATAATLTLGLAVAAAVGVIAASARASAQDAIDSTSYASLYLQGSIDSGLVRAVADRPGVLAVMRIDDPLIHVSGGTARVDGIDPGASALLVDFAVRTGSLTALHGNGLFVSTLQAASHGWHIGSRVAVTFDQGPPRTLVVAGTFADRRFLGDDYLMPITTLFHDMPDQLSEAAMLLIRAAPGTRPNSILDAIAPLLPSHPGLDLQSPTQFRATRASDLGDLSHILGALTALVVLTEIIAALSIINTLALSVTERTREFAVMRALGLTRRQLAAMIRAESVITCLLGALPGTTLGVAAGAALAATLTRNQTGVATIGLPAVQLAAVLAVTCLGALLAGAIPARRAGRVPAMAAISD